MVFIISMKVCRNGAYRCQSTDSSVKDPATTISDDPVKFPVENCKQHNNINDIKTNKSGSNGRANSVHMIGPSTTDNSQVRIRARELQQMVKDQVEKFTTERAMYSLWIFPPDDT